MLLWIASNDGLYAHSSSLLTIQFIYSGIIIGLWMAVISLPNTVKTIILNASLFFGAIATLIANLLFAIWAFDIVSSKCKDPAAFGQFYVDLCTEMSYVIVEIAFVIYFTIVDVIAVAATVIILGKAYPSLEKQVEQRV